MGNHERPDDERQLQVSIFTEATKSSRVAKMREVLTASDQKKAMLEQERGERRRLIAAAFSFLTERAMLLDMIDQARDYPSGIAESAQAEGHTILQKELDKPSLEAQEGLMMILPPGWGRLAEAKEKQPVPPVEEAEEISQNPLANKLWAEINRLKQFSTGQSMRFSRALATTLGGEGLTRDELLSQAYQPEIEQKKLDLTEEENRKKFNRSFGSLMRRAYSTFDLVHYQVVSSEEVEGVSGEAQEKRYKVVPEAAVSKGEQATTQDLGKKKGS